MSVDKLFYVTNIEHATMPSQTGIRNLVASILGDDVDNFDYSANSNIKTNTDSCAMPDGKIISIHSPVSLDIYDDAGNHTGPDENGDIEYGVDGVVYDTLDGNKFAFIPDTLHYTIKFKATGTGTAGVDVQNYSSGAIVKSELFVNVPIETLNTKGEVVIAATGSRILLDRDGDGQNTTLTSTTDVDGDLPENPSTPSEPASVGSVSSGSQISNPNLSIQTFKFLNNGVEDGVMIVKDEGIKGREIDEVMASSIPKEEVKLEDGRAHV